MNLSSTLHVYCSCDKTGMTFRRHVATGAWDGEVVRSSKGYWAVVPTSSKLHPRLEAAYQSLIEQDQNNANT